MYYEINVFNIKNTIGTNSAGKIFNVLQSLIFRMDNPEQKIRIPPTMDNSTNKVSLKNDPDRYLATK